MLSDGNRSQLTFPAFHSLPLRYRLMAIAVSWAAGAVAAFIAAAWTRS